MAAGHQNIDSYIIINDRRGSGEFMSVALRTNNDRHVSWKYEWSVRGEGHSAQLQFEACERWVVMEGEKEGGVQ